MYFYVVEFLLRFLLWCLICKGAIPGEIGRLSKMQRLSLNGNSLSSSIPYEFAENLHGLTLLTLHDNHLTGSIPQSFENFINMNWLYLYRNDFTGMSYRTYINVMPKQCLYTVVD
jgi:hypothetical protein